MSNEKQNNLLIVGRYKQIFNEILNIDLPCTDIYQSNGLQVHIKKRHPAYVEYLNNVADIIENPDYIGNNPKEKNSIEFIKCYDENILVAVKLDIKKNYLYIASLYDIKISKIQNRLHSGRLKKFSKNIDNT